MLPKIFIYVLQLTRVYTYMPKSIKDNNDTNFQKLPNNFNFEFKEIQTVEPILKYHVNIIQLDVFLRYFFGLEFMKKVDEYNIDAMEQVNLFDRTILVKLEKCQNSYEAKKLFDLTILPKLKKYFKQEEQRKIQTEYTKAQAQFQSDNIFMNLIDWFIQFIKDNSKNFNA